MKLFSKKNGHNRRASHNVVRSYDVCRGKKTLFNRTNILFIFMVGGFAIVGGRALYQQTWNNDFLRQEGDSRYEARFPLKAERGRITDRNGEFLATSVPASSIWVVPEQLLVAPAEKISELTKALNLNEKELIAKLNKHKNRHFLFLRRQVDLQVSEAVRTLKIKGVNIDSESKRYYPQGSLMAHVVGFTNIEDNGIEGLERQFNKKLEGQDGSRVVIRNRLGEVIEDVNSTDSLPAKHGENIDLTIDTRVQYIAATALQKAIKKHNAESGAAIVADIDTGEILAMISIPTYDPNDKKARKGSALRNRVVTDIFEPGSIIKPFVVGLALDAKVATKKTIFPTGNGTWKYHGATITDVSKRNGNLDLTGLLRRSSNIGMAMLSDKLNAEQMWTVFTALGFGQSPSISFPGVSSGRVRPWKTWKPIEKATMSYGYGLSVSLVQIAQAYTAFARDGDMVPLSLIKNSNNKHSVQVYSPQVARDVRHMLEEASGSQGTKIQSQVNGYRIGGKSGTARQIVKGRYSTDLHRGSYVSIAPISNPKIVVAVTIDKPKKEGYYGTVTAGPVNVEITENTLRYLGIPPDAILNNLEAKKNKSPNQG
ncbi:penicillin-binding protein 2 [Taylorella equigenitalis]|uniref:peptidoglycan D,D-transpeptidase FtsI family protein n=1 Tax=Taylorella equigenitalis TaxID=29575 RepID=UPI0024785256|nr:penicillin-binding protein 2 [Taylorella equigenitalis]WGQ18982.1 penicillin-binding protein 2 [Taylorella equigenitalis]